MKLYDKDMQNVIMFILGVYTHNGPIYYEIDEMLFKELNVKINYSTNKPIISKSLPNLSDLDNVNYFEIKKLGYYGTKNNIMIPNNVKIINNYAFAYNNKIKKIIGPSVNEVGIYAFRENHNLEVINLGNVEFLGNMLDVPKLKEVTVSSNLECFKMEDTLSKEMKFIVNNDQNQSVYEYDESLEKYFLGKVPVKKNINKDLTLFMVSNGFHKYKFPNKNYSEYFEKICQFERLFQTLPNFIIELLNNYTYFITSEFLFSGYCDIENQSIIYDMDCLNISFYHEIGHVIDYSLNFISNLDKFKDIYNEEKNNFYQNTKNPKKAFLYREFINHVIEKSQGIFCWVYTKIFGKRWIF